MPPLPEEGSLRFGRVGREGGARLRIPDEGAAGRAGRFAAKAHSSKSLGPSS